MSSNHPIDRLEVEPRTARDTLAGLLALVGVIVVSVLIVAGTHHYHQPHPRGDLPLQSSSAQRHPLTLTCPDRVCPDRGCPSLRWTGSATAADHHLALARAAARTSVASVAEHRLELAKLGLTCPGR